MWGHSLPVLMAVWLLTLCTASAATAQVRVTAAWDANSDPVTVGYVVYVGLAPGQYVAQINAGGATSVMLPLPPGATYYVAVRAYDGSAQLGPSSAEMRIDLSSGPGVPEAFRIDVNGPRALLQWAPPSSGGMPLYYQLFVGTAPGASNVVNAYTVGAGLSVSGDLPPGTYYARLRAVNLLGAGPPSAEVPFQVFGGYRPLGPSGLTAAWVGTSARLSWTPPEGPPGGPEMPSSYLIEAGSSRGASDVARFNVGNTTSLLTDVPPGTHYVRVRGVNALGVSDPSNEIVLQGQGGPGQARGLTATGSGNYVELRWSPPSSGTEPTAYLIEAGSAPGLSNLAAAQVGNVLRFATTVPSGVYYVRVRAVNARGTGAPSNEVVVRR